MVLGGRIVEKISTMPLRAKQRDSPFRLRDRLASSVGLPFWYLRDGQYPGVQHEVDKNSLEVEACAGSTDNGPESVSLANQLSAWNFF